MKDKGLQAVMFINEVMSKGWGVKPRGILLRGVFVRLRFPEGSGILWRTCTGEKRGGWVMEKRHALRTDQGAGGEKP